VCIRGSGFPTRHQRSQPSSLSIRVLALGGSSTTGRRTTEVTLPVETWLAVDVVHAHPTAIEGHVTLPCPVQGWRA
jgi:hypothetical protein